MPTETSTPTFFTSVAGTLRTRRAAAQARRQLRSGLPSNNTPSVQREFELIASRNPSESSDDWTQRFVA